MTQEIQDVYTQIADLINNDLYYKTIYEEGHIQNFYLDKDTWEISSRPEDCQYFLIFETDLSTPEKYIAAMKLMNRLYPIISHYFYINNSVTPVDENLETYWLSFPILYPHE
jgi:hypothetical protein